MASARIVETLRRIQVDYQDMPDLRLTPAQARTLWNLDEPSCDALLDVLVELKFLARTGDGAFIWNRDGS